jgi:hypothetical protein
VYSTAIMDLNFHYLGDIKLAIQSILTISNIF